MSKKLDAIRKAKDWQTQAKLASDATPGTAFDSLFDDALLSLEYPVLAKDIWMKLGEELALNIKLGNSQAMYDMAAALNAWKRHKPKPDHVAEAIAFIVGMFPGNKHTVRNVIMNLREHGHIKGLNEKSVTKTIGRRIRDLGLESKFDHTAGARGD